MRSTNQKDRNVNHEIFQRYKRAEALDQMCFSPYMELHCRIMPTWIDESTFWYSRNHKMKTEYRVVDILAKTNLPAFDHLALAKSLSEAANTRVDSNKLPINNLVITSSEIRFDGLAKRWKFSSAEDLTECQQEFPPTWLFSPDGSRAVYVEEHNLWCYCVQSKQKWKITNDGKKYNAYATAASRNLMSDIDASSAVNKCNPWDETHLPEAQWSPDSRRLFTVQLDERGVEVLPSILFVPPNGGLRPKSTLPKYALPGDKVIARYRFLVIDLDSGRQTFADYPDVEDSFIALGPFSGNRAWWSKDSRRTYLLDMARGQKSVRVVALEVESSESKVLFEESSDTFLELGHAYEKPSIIIPISETNELVWFSYRTGFAHLYLYDLNSGKLKNAITSGNYNVSDAFLVDGDAREITLQAMGRKLDRDLYYREILRVNIDSGNIVEIASSNHDYDMYTDFGGMGGLSPDGSYIVSTHSRIDTPCVADVRSKYGDVIVELERSDLAYLPNNWNWPQPSKTTAADGETSIYGALFFPSDFDPKRKYPVLDFCQSNPFYAGVPKRAFANSYECAAAFAELGMIVVMLDGRGTCFREKKFRDFGYTDFMDQGGIVDRVAGIKELAKDRPYMDLSRVGIADFDGSNAGVLGLLGFPEFYRVGVASSLYDPRLVKQGEVYSGLISEELREAFPMWDRFASRLEGKLLLITGLRDRFFHPSCTFQLTNALLRENKKFLHFVHPLGGHAWRVVNGRGRIWDFLTKNLIREMPPEDYMVFTGFELLVPEDMTEISEGGDLTS